jgi:hypothetical protein
MQFVVHALSLANFPCRANPDRSAASPYILVDKKQYKAPRLFASQVNLLLLKDHTIVTVRKRTEDKSVAELFDPMIADVMLSSSTSFLPFSFSFTTFTSVLPLVIQLSIDPCDDDTKAFIIIRFTSTQRIGITVIT